MTEAPAATACPLCAFDEWAYAFTIQDVPVRRCRNCGLARSRSFAAGSAAPPRADVAGDVASSDECLQWLERLGPIPSPLLIIVSPGHPLPERLRGRGADVEACDGAQLGLRPFSAGTFQAALIFDQLERSADPIRSLEIIHDALAPDGLLMAVVPSLQRWLAGRFLRGPERRGPRPYYFTRTTLESALIRSAFSRVSFPVVRRRDWRSRLLVTARAAVRRRRPLLSVVLPVYNEKKYFARTMNALLDKQLAGVDKEVIVVENNSTDGTRDDVVAYQGRPGVRVILQDRPRGKGHAVRAALECATGDIVLIQDADWEYDINDYDELLKPLLTFKTAFVLGSRHSGDWKIRQFDAEPRLETFMNFGHQVFTTLVNVMYGQKLKDPFTMYKVFRRDCLYGLKFECNRFDFDFELVIKLIRKGYQPIEIPVNYQTRSWAEGKKVRIGWDPLTWIVALVKYRFAGIFKD